MWLEAMPTSTALRESIYGYPILLTSHVVSMCLIAGLLVMMDLRLLGVGNRSTPVSHTQTRLFPWQMVGLGLSVVSGGLLFYGQPMRFYPNFWFWMKNLLLLSALANAMYFHLTTYRTVDEWDTDPIPPFQARLAGGLGLMFWAAIIVTAG